jgi:hypothetical protein
MVDAIPTVTRNAVSEHGLKNGRRAPETSREMALTPRCARPGHRAVIPKSPITAVD